MCDVVGMNCDDDVIVMCMIYCCCVGVFIIVDVVLNELVFSRFELFRFRFRASRVVL